MPEDFQEEFGDRVHDSSTDWELTTWGGVKDKQRGNSKGIPTDMATGLLLHVYIYLPL